MSEVVGYLVVVAAAITGCSPNLAWEEPKTYTPPPTSTIYVDGFGINDSVTILGPSTAGIMVSHGVVNNGRGSAANYTAVDSVVRWIFQGSPTTGYGWVQGTTAAYVVPTLPAAGPTLAAGGRGSVTFPPFAVPSACGLYSETLLLDTAKAVSESNEADNIDAKKHFFFVPSSQHFNIAVVELVPGGMTHDGPQATHTFTVTAAGAPQWIYAGFSFVATEGSTATTIPAPGVIGGPGPMVITMTVTPQKHSSAGGTVTGKVTVISQDGCVLKQQTATIFVEHR